MLLAGGAGAAARAAAPGRCAQGALGSQRSMFPLIPQRRRCWHVHGMALACKRILPICIVFDPVLSCLVVQ